MSIETEITEPESLGIEFSYSDYNGYGVSCYGSNDGYIDLIGEGGTGNYFYDWSNGAQTNNLQNIPAGVYEVCLLYTSPSPRDGLLSRMPSSA